MLVREKRWFWTASIDNGLRRGLSWSWRWSLFALRGRQVAGARGASGTTDLSGRTNLNDRFRSCNGRRAYRAEIGGAASIKVSSFESIESRNDRARRRSEILKQDHDRVSVAANQCFLLASRVSRCGRSRGRRPRALPYHRSGTRTRPMEKGARGTEVLAQTNVMFQRAECDAYLARLSANSLRVSGRGKSEGFGSRTELVSL